MSDQLGPSKRLSAVPDHVKKCLKSAEVEKLLLDSDDNFYAGSDIDDINYECGYKTIKKFWPPHEIPVFSLAMSVLNE